MVQIDDLLKMKEDVERERRQAEAAYHRLNGQIALLDVLIGAWQEGEVEAAQGETTENK